MSDMVNTVCNTCIFAKTDIDSPCQCKIGILDKFRKLGRVQELFLDNNNTDKSTVVSRICVYYRTPQWKYYNSDEQYAIARKEVQLRPDIIVYLKSNQTLSDLYQTCVSLHNTTLPPANICVVVTKKYRLSEMVRFCRENLAYKWNFEIAQYDSGNNINEECELITIGLKKAKSPYILVLKAGEEVYDDAIEKADIAINDNLQQVLMIEPRTDGFHYMLMSRQLALLIGGRIEPDFVEVIKNICEQQETPHLVTTWSQL